MSRKAKSGSGSGFFGRLFRSIFSIIVISSLILAIGYFTKSLSGLTPVKFAETVSSLASKIPGNVDSDKVGEVAGKFAERISQTDLGSGVSTSRETGDGTRNELIRVAIISDIHEDVTNLDKAISQIKAEEVYALFILGDISNYGEITSLERMRTVLDDLDITYYIIPGDHDLAASGDVTNFNEVFGKDSAEVTIKGVKFMLFNNSANKTPLTEAQLNWFSSRISDSQFILLGQPLYTAGLNPPFKDKYMGAISDASQRDAILSKIRSVSSIKAVIAGDHHKSSRLEDPIRKSLTHYAVGAVSSTVNDYPQDVIQSPRFSILTVYENGDYELKDVVIKSEQ